MSFKATGAKLSDFMEWYSYRMEIWQNIFEHGSEAMRKLFLKEFENKKNRFLSKVLEGLQEGFKMYWKVLKSLKT